jgi:hypothetical protein
MGPAVHRVQFFEAECRHCKWTFSMPLLGDQSYGQFIFHGDKGDVFVYLPAFEEPAWDDITKRLKDAGLFADSADGPEIDRFQRVIAASADSIRRQTLELFPSCPRCHSDSVSYGDSKPLGIHEIPRVTFDKYQLLSDEQKTTRLCELWRQLA